MSMQIFGITAILVWVTGCRLLDHCHWD